LSLPSLSVGLSSLSSSSIGPPSLLADPPSSHQALSSIPPVFNAVGIGGYLVDFVSGSFSNALAIVE
ncbi:hypothetical protein LINPERHAP2_LOCUS8921, partial [Linum perenne]